MIGELPFSGAVLDRRLRREFGFEQEHDQFCSSAPCVDEHLFGPGGFVELLHLRCDVSVPMLQVFVAERLQLMLPPVALSGQELRNVEQKVALVLCRRTPLVLS